MRSAAAAQYAPCYYCRQNPVAEKLIFDFSSHRFSPFFFFIYISCSCPVYGCGSKAILSVIYILHLSFRNISVLVQNIETKTFFLFVLHQKFYLL